MGKCGKNGDSNGGQRYTSIKSCNDKETVFFYLMAASHSCDDNCWYNIIIPQV